MTIVQLECRPEHNHATFFSQELGNDSDRGTGGDKGALVPPLFDVSIFFISISDPNVYIIVLVR